VDEFDVDTSHLDDIAGLMGHEIGASHSGRTFDPGCFEGVHVNGHRAGLEKTGDPFDAVAHHRSTHVIGVVVGGQHAGDSHSVLFGDGAEVVDAVGRIDDQTFSGRSIADQVDEVRHLVRQAVIDGEVVTGQQLAEVEIVVDCSLVHSSSYASDVSTSRLERLVAGSRIPFGGDREAVVGEELARDFASGDSLIVVQSSGELIRVPAAVSDVVRGAVDRAVDGFEKLAEVPADATTRFYELFARGLEDDETFASIATANRADVEAARAKGRSTTRLELTPVMRTGMVEALRMWRDIGVRPDRVVSTVEHEVWTVEERLAPLGVVGFVFEGRPNVFADATGVLRGGNSVVFRIGSDALGTARAIMDSIVRPALLQSGLPDGCVSLVESPDRAAGLALFSDARLALAVARGSGEAVALLGSVARQSGIPVSLHGTGGAWMIVEASAESANVSSPVEASLDRKVCNTANVVVCVNGAHVHEVVAAADLAARRRGHDSAIVHVRRRESVGLPGPERIVEHDSDDFLSVEWEWEDRPELSVVIVADRREAIALFDLHAPRFVVSVLSGDPEALSDVYRFSNAPFVGDGFTRWVDGQYALGRPELGLSNWQAGRLFGRGGILSGDGVYTIRHLARHRDPRQRR